MSPILGSGLIYDSFLRFCDAFYSLDFQDITKPFNISIADLIILLDENIQSIKYFSNLEYLRQKKTNKNVDWSKFKASKNYTDFIEFYNNMGEIMGLHIKYKDRTNKSVKNSVYIRLRQIFKSRLGFEYNEYTDLPNINRIVKIDKKGINKILTNEATPPNIEVSKLKRAVNFKEDGEAIILYPNKTAIYKQEGDRLNLRHTNGVYWEQSKDLTKYEAVKGVNTYTNYDKLRNWKRQNADSKKELEDEILNNRVLLSVGGIINNRELPPIYSTTDIYKYNEEVELLGKSSRCLTYDKCEAIPQPKHTYEQINQYKEDWTNWTNGMVVNDVMSDIIDNIVYNIGVEAF